MQQASVNMFYQKKWKTDIFNKSAFANRKLIVIYFFLSSLFILGFYLFIFR